MEPDSGARARLPLLCCALAIAVTGLFSFPAFAAGGAVESSRPAPIASYLMADRVEETALARSAAPPGIGAASAVWLLEADGYRETVAGTNGFACLVGRAWSAPLRFVNGVANDEFWNPRVRAPMCLNPEAVRTILPVLQRRTELAIAGKSLGEIEADANARFAAGSFRPPHGIAMSYMFSKDQYLGDRVRHFTPHVMLYAPFTENADWGDSSGRSGWPFVGENQGNAHALVIIPVGRWSDGSAVAPAGAH